MYPNPNPYGNQQTPLGFTGYPSGNPPYPQQSQGFPVPNCPYPQGQPAVGAYPQQYPAPGYPGQNTSVPGYPPSPYSQPPISAPNTTSPYPQAPISAPNPASPYPQAPISAPSPYPTASVPPAAFPPAVSSGYPSCPAGGYPASAPYTDIQQSQATNYYASSASPVPAMSQQYQDIPTLRETPCDPMMDAQVLRKAMKGFGTDEKAIISVLGHRTDNQRQQIIQAYKSSFGKDLIKDLKSELSGRFEDVIVALMTPRIDFLAMKLRSAISGIGTKESIIVDILCSSTNQEIHMIKSAYQRLYGTPLEKDIRGDTSGHFERLLVSLCQGLRSEDPVANPAMAADDAQKLLNAGEKKFGTDESMFNMILANRSYAQLRLMFHEYERITGHDFERAISSEFSGDVEAGMMAVVKCSKNRAAYFAQRLHQSISGFGTKDNDLIFIVVTRAEIDLGSIMNEYQRIYHKSLASAVSGDTSGDYKKILLALMGV